MTTNTIRTNHLNNNNEPLPLPFRVIGVASRTVGSLFPNLFGRLMVNLFRTPIKTAVPKSRDIESAEQIAVPYDGGTLAVYCWGEGPTVLLVHGWRAHAGRYRYMIPQLVENGYRVVALDIPAHGNSTGNQTDPFHTAKGIATVIRHIGPLYAMVAHSFGAASTAALFSQEPALLPERVVLMGCPNEMTEIMASFSAILGLPDRVFKAMLKQVERATGAPMSDARTAQWVAPLELPALIVHDEQDEIVGYQSAKTISSAWPTAELMTTNGLGHSGILRDAGVINKIVAFLD